MSTNNTTPVANNTGTTPANTTGMNQTGMNQTGMNQTGMNQTGMNQAGMNQTGMNQTGMNQANNNNNTSGMINQDQLLTPEDTPNIGEVQDLSELTGETPSANNVATPPNFNNKKQQQTNARYTNDDVAKIFKIYNMIHKLENQQPQQQMMMQQQPMMMPQQPMMMPQQPMMMPQPQMMMGQSALTYTDREEIRGMINRYSEDTEKILKDYIKENNDKIVAYVKELFAYKQNVDTLIKKAENDNAEAERKRLEEESSSSNSLLNSITSIPKQFGNAISSVKNAVANTVNAVNSRGKTPPANITTPAANNTTPQSINSEAQINSVLKNSTPPSPPDLTPPPSLRNNTSSPPSPPDLTPPQSLRNNSSQQQPPLVDKITNDLKNIQKGGSLKLTRKRVRKNKNKNKSRIREKK